MTDTPIAYRVPQACKASGIGRTKLYELMRSGALPVKRIGGITLIRRADLEALLASDEKTAG